MSNLFAALSGAVTLAAMLMSFASSPAVQTSELTGTEVASMFVGSTCPSGKNLLPGDGTANHCQRAKTDCETLYHDITIDLSVAPFNIGVSSPIVLKFPIGCNENSWKTERCTEKLGWTIENAAPDHSEDGVTNVFNEVCTAELPEQQACNETESDPIPIVFPDELEDLADEALATLCEFLRNIHIPFLGKPLKNLDCDDWDFPASGQIEIDLPFMMECEEGDSSEDTCGNYPGDVRTCGNPNEDAKP